MNKIGKKPKLTFIATLDEKDSLFYVEGMKDVYIPSYILRRNFPQAKTNTRLKIQFYPWEVDIGRTIWLHAVVSYNGEMLTYTFSRKGKIVSSLFPSYFFQSFLREKLLIRDHDVVRFKMVVTGI